MLGAGKGIDALANPIFARGFAFLWPAHLAPAMAVRCRCPFGFIGISVFNLMVGDGAGDFFVGGRFFLHFFCGGIRWREIFMKFLLSILGFVFANAPECVMSGVCRAVGFLICYFPNRRTRVAFSNIYHCFPEMGRRERMKIAYESCARMVEMALFVVASPHMSVARLSGRVKLSGTMKAELEKYSENPHPLVLMIPHFAMMETITMFPLLAGNLKLPAVGVFYRPFDSAGMEAWVRESRQRFGIEMLSRRDGILHSARILKENGCVAVLFDQNAGGAGCESLFFGRVCHTSELAGILAEKTGARVAVFYARRTGFWRSEVDGEFLDASGIEDITYSGNVWLENKLKSSRTARFDWLWLHRRWRTHPDQRTSLRLRGGKSILDYSLRRMGLDSLPRKSSIFVTLPDGFSNAESIAPILATLRASRPDARVSVLCSGACAAALSRRPECADAVIELPPRVFGRLPRLRFFGKLSLSYPDINIVFDDSAAADIEAFALGAQQRNAVESSRRRRFMTGVYKAAGGGGLDPRKILETLEYFGMKSAGCGEIKKSEAKV